MLRTVSRSTPSPRRFFFILGGVVAIIVLMAVLLTHLTKPATDAATAGLRAIGAEGKQSAWQHGSVAFRRTVPEPEWERYATAHDLARVGSITWNDRTVHDNRALIRGWVTTTGHLHLARVILDYEDGAWRIATLSIDGDRLGPIDRPFWR